MLEIGNPLAAYMQSFIVPPEPKDKAGDLVDSVGSIAHGEDSGRYQQVSIHQNLGSVRLDAQSSLSDPELESDSDSDSDSLHTLQNLICSSKFQEEASQ